MLKPLRGTLTNVKELEVRFMTDSRNLRGPAWGLPTPSKAPLYPPHLLNEMERFMRKPALLVEQEASTRAAAETALLAYLREHVPHLIEAVRRADEA